MACRLVSAKPFGLWRGALISQFGTTWHQAIRRHKTIFWDHLANISYQKEKKNHKINLHNAPMITVIWSSASITTISLNGLAVKLLHNFHFDSRPSAITQILGLGIGALISQFGTTWHQAISRHETVLWDHLANISHQKKKITRSISTMHLWLWSFCDHIAPCQHKPWHNILTSFSHLKLSEMTYQQILQIPQCIDHMSQNTSVVRNVHVCTISLQTSAFGINSQCIVGFVKWSFWPPATIFIIWLRLSTSLC